jgi:hypothetical protein
VPLVASTPLTGTGCGRFVPLQDRRIRPQNRTAAAASTILRHPENKYYPRNARWVDLGIDAFSQELGADRNYYKLIAQG